ncbi:MAG: response regulator transcription factor [Oscillospiraceae bacterium]|nr:response regulator transcription factor [Oscillospiraceae bacterium]
MKKMRIAIFDNDAAETEFYKSLCRETAQKNNIPVELKLYHTTDSLLSDLDSPEFRKALDVIFFALAKDNLEIPDFIRNTGYINLIVFIGGAEMILPYEQLFDTDAYNFVQKSRTQEHLDRFEHILQNAARDVAKKHNEKLSVSYGGEIRQIDINDIQYFEVQQRALVVHYGEGESFTFVTPLAKIENNLKGRPFARASRFHLISLDAVEKLTYTNVLMQDGTNILVGRKYYPALKSALDKRAT